MVDRKPEWLKIRLRTDGEYQQLKNMMRQKTLHTVCEEARCPNIYECWSERTATFMILGDLCTRKCRFCAVKTGLPTGLDKDEPDRVAEAVEKMGLSHVVVTSVARDDLPDGGASIFAETIVAIRRRMPECNVEVLIPDFGGDWNSLRLVLEASPAVLNHNVETVQRLSDRIRSKARYDRSLALLRTSKEIDPRIPTKSSIMVGVGEEYEELLETMDDLRKADVDLLTIGQYLAPSASHIRVARYYTPEEFASLREEGLKRGFRHVESGPLVRSSYHAHQQVKAATTWQQV